jgi:hypothetical protein
MGAGKIIRLTSVGELRDAARYWDDLWWRSEITTPTARAELLALWLEQFAPKTAVEIIVLQSGETWVAALPLRRTKVRHVLDAVELCGSTWISGGCLLADSSMDLDSIMDSLVYSLRTIPYQLLWLEGVALSSARWQAFQRAVERARMARDINEEYQTGILPICHDWEGYKANWTKNHRRKMRHCAGLSLANQVQFSFHRQLPPGDVETYIRRALEVEDRSWKGESGTSILRRGEYGYVLRQARQLADWGQLELAFLETHGRMIAFAYGYQAKGVHHICKIGYDPDYAALTPGQLLLYHLIESLHADPESQTLDFFGKLTESISRWQPRPLPMGRIVVAPRRLFGRLALSIYKLNKRRKNFSTSYSESTMRDWGA